MAVSDIVHDAMKIQNRYRFVFPRLHKTKNKTKKKMRQRRSSWETQRFVECPPTGESRKLAFYEIFPKKILEKKYASKTAILLFPTFHIN